LPLNQHLTETQNEENSNTNGRNSSTKNKRGQNQVNNKNPIPKTGQRTTKKAEIRSQDQTLRRILNQSPRESGTTII